MMILLLIFVFWDVVDVLLMMVDVFDDVVVVFVVVVDVYFGLSSVGCGGCCNCSSRTGEGACLMLRVAFMFGLSSENTVDRNVNDVDVVVVVVVVVLLLLLLSSLSSSSFFVELLSLEGNTLSGWYWEGMWNGCVTRSMSGSEEYSAVRCSAVSSLWKRIFVREWVALNIGSGWVCAIDSRLL